MTHKWGFCPRLGALTFAADTAHHEPRFQDFTIAHELLHRGVPNRSKLLKA